MADGCSLGFLLSTALALKAFALLWCISVFRISSHSILTFYFLIFNFYP